MARWEGSARWFAAEFLVVVCGVLVALAAGAWASGRMDRDREQLLLRGLRSELAANLVLFDSTAQQHRAVIGQSRRLLTWTGPTPVGFEPTEVDSLLFALISDMPSYHPSMGEMEAMLGSGGLALIRDGELRAAIASWPGILELLRETEDEMRSDVLTSFYPYVIQRTPLLTIDHTVGLIRESGPSRFSQGYVELLSDVAFENHVENRWVMSRFILEDGEPVRALLEHMIRLIDSQLPD